MFIGMEIIADVLNEYEKRIHKADHDYCIIGVVPLGETLLPFSQHMLYMVKNIKELKAAELAPYMNILIFNPEREDPDVYLSPDTPVNYIEVFNHDEVPVLQRLRDFLNDVIAGALISDTLLDMLFYDRSIQDMVDSFTRGFDNPVFVFDAGFHLIAANHEMVKGDENAEKIIKNGRLSDEDFSLLNDRTMPYDIIRKREKPVIVRHREIGVDQMICAIDAKKDIGHIVMNASNRPFIPTDEKLMMILRKGIHQQMIKQDFIRNNTGFPYEYFLKDLLDGKVAVKLRSYNRMDYVNSEFSDNLYCMVTEVARSTGVLNTYRIRNEFESLISGTKTMMYGGEIIVLFALHSGEAFEDDKLEKLKNICHGYGLYSGMSNNFTNILDLSAYYKQALRAIELGAEETNEPGLYTYSHYYMQHIFNVFSNKADVRTFCCPRLQILLDYDKENGTEFAYSLYMYLINERNSIAASNAMFIHRNTLLYRLRKIDSLVNIDYNSYEERRYIILSYEMMFGTKPPSGG